MLGSTTNATLPANQYLMAFTIEEHPSKFGGALKCANYSGSEDVAVQICDLILSGSFFSFWRADLNNPSVTLLGKVCDWMWGVPTLTNNDVNDLLGTGNDMPKNERPYLYTGRYVSVISYTGSMYKVCAPISHCAQVKICESSKEIAG